MKKCTAAFSALVALLVFTLNAAYALDPPHNATDRSNPVYCSMCHIPSNAPIPSWALVPRAEDNTAFSYVCQQCHNVGRMENKFGDVVKHSSYRTSLNHGVWMMECTTCHNHHWQEQTRGYPTEGIIASGTVRAIATGSTSTVTVSNVLPENAYARYLLVPNQKYPGFMFKIRGNTANTITVDGAINLNYAGVGDIYAIKYGKNIRTEIWNRQVKFLNNEGQYSFADNDSIIDGICQVCHTKTKSFTNSGTLEGPGHPEGTAGTNCMRCHPHSRGFKAMIQ